MPGISLCRKQRYPQIALLCLVSACGNIRQAKRFRLNLEKQAPERADVPIELGMLGVFEVRNQAITSIEAKNRLPAKSGMVSTPSA